MLGLRPHSPAQTVSAAVEPSLDRLIGLRSEVLRLRMDGPLGITQLPGLARTRLRGRGLDFDELRPYAEGDDIRHIDWNVTARTGRPHTRLYREERERAVTVAVDLRPSMFTGSKYLKAAAAAEYAAALLWQVSANRDRAGLMAFDGRETLFSRPASRQAGVLEALGLLTGLYRDAVSRLQQRSAPLADALGAINRMPRSAGLTLLLTDAHDLGPDFDDEARMAAQRNRLAVVRLVDPLEVAGLPPGRYGWSSGGEGGRTDLSRAAADALRTDLDRRNAAVEARFRLQGLPLVALRTDVAPADIWFKLVEQGIV